MSVYSFLFNSSLTTTKREKMTSKEALIKEDHILLQVDNTDPAVETIIIHHLVVVVVINTPVETRVAVAEILNSVAMIDHRDQAETTLEDTNHHHIGIGTTETEVAVATEIAEGNPILLLTPLNILLLIEDTIQVIKAHIIDLNNKT